MKLSPGWWIPWVVIGGVLSLFGGIVFSVNRFINSGERTAAEAYDRECGIYATAYVRSKLDGRPGMVTGYDTYSQSVYVRFAQPQARTNVSLLGSDGAIGSTPYAEVRMRCFEVELFTEEQPE